jgi:hypothetical protein
MQKLVIRMTVFDVEKKPQEDKLLDTLLPQGLNDDQVVRLLKWLALAARRQAYEYLNEDLFNARYHDANVGGP